MSKLRTAVMTLLAVSMSWGQLAHAQDDANKASPLEFFACNYAKGKGLKDLEKVAGAFGDWTKENDMSYVAWAITPQFHDGDLGFDVGWLGGWPDAMAFGKGQDTWLSGGGKLAADFERVIDCSGGHQMVTSVGINAPDAPPGDGVVMFAQCSLNEGATMTESYEAHMKMGASAKAAGSQTSSWLFYPLLGGGDAGFDYFLVLGAPNYTAIGAGLEAYLNGGGYQQAQDLLGDVETCSTPTVFDAKVLVSGS